MTTDREHAEARLKAFDAIATVLQDPVGFLHAMFEAEDPAAAVSALRDVFGLDEEQAAVVLDLQFRQVTAKERTRILDARGEVQAHLDSLRGSLG